MKTPINLVIILLFSTCSSDDRLPLRPVQSAQEESLDQHSDDNLADVDALDRAFATATVTAPPSVPINDTVNVQSYGAKGDGKTDDTAALNLAAKAIRASLRGVKTNAGSMIFRAKELYFPAGNYLITAPIKIEVGVISIRSEGGATIQQKSTVPIFIFNNPKAGATKVKVHGIQFLYGTNQIYFANANLNAASLTIENCEFHESSRYAIQTYGKGEDHHLSTMVLIENSKFMNSAGVLSNYADSAMIRDSWIQVSSATLQPHSSVIHNGSGTLKLDNVFAIPGIVDAFPRVPGVHWIRITGGSVNVNQSRFGGEGAGYPIVTFEGHGPLVGGVSQYPYFGSTISIENSAICAGGGKTPDAAVVNIKKGMPHSIRLVNNTCLIGSPFLRLHNFEDTRRYIESALPEVALQVFHIVLGPNSVTPSPLEPETLKLLAPFMRH